jgi:hypothetical protein
VSELDFAVLILIAYEIGVGESAVELISRYLDYETEIGSHRPTGRFPFR